MLSRTAQYRLVWRGALLAAVIGSGWSCSKLVGADFDKPLMTGGTGGSDAASSGSDGAGGAPTSTTSDGAGGTTSTSNAVSSSVTTSTSTTSSASSSSSGTSCVPQGSLDSLCGPDGKDDNCNGVVGDCDDIQTVYVGMKVTDVDDCTNKGADFRISTVMGDLPSDFPAVAQFQTFTQKPSGTNVIELSTCLGGGGHHIISFGTASCTPSSTEYKSLGYVSTKVGMGYEQLSLVSNGGNTAVIPVSASDQMTKICFCHNTTCNAVSEYVLK